MTPLLDHIEAFIAAMPADFSVGTRRVTLVGLSHFREFVYKRGGKFQPVTWETVNDFIADQFAKGTIGPGTIRRKVARVGQFWAWLHLRKIVGGVENPARDPRITKITVTSGPRREMFTEQQFRKLLVKARTHKVTDWYCAILTAWHTGLRKSDVYPLLWSEVDIDRELITRVPWKTRRLKPQSVEIPIDPELLDALRDQKLKASGMKSPFVFPTLAYWYQAPSRMVDDLQFRALCDSLGMHKLSFHCLRHSFISRMLNAGVDGIIIASMTGLSLAMIQSYSHVSMDAKRAAMLRAGLAGSGVTPENIIQLRATPPAAQPEAGTV